MEKDLLTSNQRKILEVISKDKFITERFFLTGGTALSAFYFGHRISEDLDFFSEREFESKTLLISVKNLAKVLRAKNIEQQTLAGQQVFYLYFDKTKPVKIDFAFFPFPHLGSFKKFGNLKISSIEDMAINKLHAIQTRKRARDYLDLYLSMEHLDWQVKDLQKNYKLKFDANLSVEQIATSFTNVVDSQDLPVFLGKIPWKKVSGFFLKLVEAAKSEIIR